MVYVRTATYAYHVFGSIPEEPITNKTLTYSFFGMLIPFHIGRVIVSPVNEMLVCHFSLYYMSGSVIAYWVSFSGCGPQVNQVN